MAGWRKSSGKKPNSNPPAGARESAASSKSQGWRSGKEPSPSSGQHWKQPRGRSSGFGRGARLAGLLLAFFLLVGVLTRWLLNMPVSVPFVALTTAPYEFPLPPLPLAQEDMERFQDVLGTSHPNVTYHASQSPIRSREELIEELRFRLQQVERAGGPQKNAMMIYLRAHGAVDETGEPCLLLPASLPLDESTWLPVRELIKIVRARDPDADLEKVLLLDCSSVRRFWQAGILHNTFLPRLEALLAEFSDSKISVIHAADANQTSHAAPELGGTAFANYLVQGIRGEADLEGDDVITLHELHQYVQNKVDRFVHDRRANTQRPVLLPRDAADFPLAHASRSSADLEAPIETPTFDLDETWQRYADLRQRRVYELDPAAWAELEARLVRLESLTLAGKAYASQLDKREATLLIDHLQRLLDVDVDAASNLAVASRTLSSDAIAEARAAVDAWNASLGSDNELETPKLPEPLASQLGWDLATGGKRTNLDAANQLLQHATTQRRVDFVEIQFMKIIAAWMDWGGANVDLIQQSLWCQQKAEEAASPADARSHYWVRDLVAKADLRNDQMMDAMLAGSPSSREQAIASFASLVGEEGSYPDAVELSDVVSRSHALRDEAWATIPHLAAWIDIEAWFDSAGIQTDGQSRSVTYSESLQKLITDSHRLDDAIDRLPLDLESASQARERLESQSAAVQVGLGALIGAFDRKCSILLNDETFKDDERTIRQIAAILELPLLPNNRVSDRVALAERLRKHRIMPYADNGEAFNQDIRDGSLFIEWMSDMDRPHLSAIVDREYLPNYPREVVSQPPPKNASQVERLGRLEKFEQEIREALRSTRRLAADVAASKARTNEPAECRRPLCTAERVVRTASPILARRLWLGPDADNDPIARRRAFDKHAFRIWHGYRGLERFWAAVDRQKQPYFVQLAEQQLAADNRYAQTTPRGRPEFESAAEDYAKLRSRVRQQEAVLNGWKPAVAAAPLTVTSDEVPHTVSAIAPTTPLPSGAMSVYLSDPTELLEVRNQRNTVRRRAVRTNSARTLQHLIFNARQLSIGSLYANALFRGHHRMQPFDVNDPGRMITVWCDRRPEPPRITVRGDSREKSQIMFVLDCSGSMDDEPFGRKPTRLAFAIETLSRTIDLLDDNHFVGLMLYGHRAIDNKAINPEAAADVEIVQPIARKNDEAERDSIKRKFEGRRARGATPLYLAIQQAIESFNLAIDGVKTVVVLTDGDNKVPGGGPNPTASDVIATWNRSRHKPFIHIVSIAKGLTRPTELRDITSGRGELHQDVSAEDLRETIERAVGLRTFRIEGLESKTSSSEIRLGATWIDRTYQDWDLHKVRRRYRVHVGAVSEEVELEGGEHVQVIFNQRRGRLEFPPYLRNADQRVSVPSSAELFAVSHVTRKPDRSHYFEVSIQNRDAFTPRPRHVWAEIRPQGFASDSSTIYAYDTDFLMRSPVPVFQFRVENWPGAETAKVKLWFTYRDQIAGEQRAHISTSEETVVDTSAFPGVHLKAVPRRLANGDVQLTVLETHDENAPKQPLRIRAIPFARRAEHRSFENVRRIQHVFTLPNTSRIELGLSRDSHLKQEWLETESFDVTLPNR